MKRGIFASPLSASSTSPPGCALPTTKLLATGRDYGETPALATRGVFTSTRVRGVLTDWHPGSSGLSQPMANGRLPTPRCTTLATQQRPYSGYGRITALILLRGVARVTWPAHVVKQKTIWKTMTVLSSFLCACSSVRCLN